MNRRTFTASLGVGLLGASSAAARSLRDWSCRDLSWASLEMAETDLAENLVGKTPVEHWRVAQNNTWRWFEKSVLIGSTWRMVGMTTPVRRASGFQISGRDCADYLHEAEVPQAVVEAFASGSADICIAREGATPGPAATDQRKAREGRPPSRWLRDLDALQLRSWLGCFDPPRADVAGMTFYEHLTRDHGFSEESVALLTKTEQHKLHGAAHHGY
ncbi:MAG: hypothetical protein AAF589_05455 [Planctomycetota bacterium]